MSPFSVMMVPSSSKSCTLCPSTRSDLTEIILLVTSAIMVVSGRDRLTIFPVVVGTKSSSVPHRPCDSSTGPAVDRLTRVISVSLSADFMLSPMMESGVHPLSTTNVNG